MMNHTWTIAERSGPVCPLYPGTETAWGRRRQTWLRTVESDVTPLNSGLATAYHQAQNRHAWRSLVEMATSIGQTFWGRWWWW